MEANELKKRLFDIQLDDEDYYAMLLSYLLKLSSFELTRRNLNIDFSKKEKITDEDIVQLESAENYVRDIVQVIDTTIFTPCLINYLKKYHPEMLDDMIDNKGKIITMLNNKAKAAIDREIEQFNGLGGNGIEVKAGE